jgi:hypothetical protein
MWIDRDDVRFQGKNGRHGLKGKPTRMTEGDLGKIGY